MSSGVSELIGYYATENFVVETSDTDKLKVYLSELSEEMDRKPSRSLLNGICEEFGSDFIIKPEINFAEKFPSYQKFTIVGEKSLPPMKVYLRITFILRWKNTQKNFKFSCSKNKSVSNIDSSSEEEIVFY